MSAAVSAQIEFREREVEEVLDRAVKWLSITCGGGEQGTGSEFPRFLEEDRKRRGYTKL